MERSLLALVAVFTLAACSSPGASRLSYAEVQAINPGVSGEWVLQEFPFGSVARGEDGVVDTLSYRVQDPRGSGQKLTLLCDDQGRVCQKLYTGQVLRPGGPQGGPQTGVQGGRPTAAQAGRPCAPCATPGAVPADSSRTRTRSVSGAPTAYDLRMPP